MRKYTFSNNIKQICQNNCIITLETFCFHFLLSRFEAAKLVMQWLCNHEDQNMQRMAVAIISILAAKVYIVWLYLYHTGSCSCIHNMCRTVLKLIIVCLSQLSTEQTAQLGAELFIVRVRFSSLLYSFCFSLIYHKKQIFIANMLFPACSNCSTLCVRRLLRAWWTPPSNLHSVHSGISLMNHQQPAAILSRTRVWTCSLQF